MTFQGTTMTASSKREAAQKQRPGLKDFKEDTEEGSWSPPGHLGGDGW